MAWGVANYDIQFFESDDAISRNVEDKTHAVLTGLWCSWVNPAQEQKSDPPRRQYLSCRSLTGAATIMIASTKLTENSTLVKAGQPRYHAEWGWSDTCSKVDHPLLVCVLLHPPKHSSVSTWNGKASRRWRVCRIRGVTRQTGKPRLSYCRRAIRSQWI